MADKRAAVISRTYPIALLLALAICGAGVALGVSHHIWDVAAIGALGVIAVMICWPIAAAIARSREEVIAAEARFASVSERLEQFSVILNLISEQQLLSDRAKSVAFREKERDALRRAIAEETARGDFEGAMALANDMDESFGLKQEADRFRQDITHRRADLIRRQINDAVAVIDRHCRTEQWQQALREADRVAQLFPADEVARRLPSEIETRRQNHKLQLVQSFHDARGRNDVDGAIEIVKQLDMYLTPAEAADFQEQVRNVFKEKLNNLRARFSLAVRDGHWDEAIRVGEIITRDFPNTQMAKEVREHMDGLRERNQEAGSTQAAAV